MKKLILILLSTITSLNICAQTLEIKKDTNFNFENSNDFTNKEEKLIWHRKGEKAIIKLGYWRGDCCGGVPRAEQLTATIINDTVFYDRNYKRKPNCSTESKLCGNAINFIISIKKYPNYKKWIFKEVAK